MTLLPGLLLTGCGRSSDVTVVTIQTIAGPESNPDQYRLVEALVAEFSRRHPEIQVKLAGERPGLELLIRSVIAKQSADVIDVGAGEVEFLAERHCLTPVNAECGRLEPALNARAWEFGHVDAALYAVPWAARPKLLLYDKAAFRRAGLSDDAPPQTWAELLAAAEKLTRDTSGDGKPDVFGFALAGKNGADLGRHFATFVAQFGRGLIATEEGREGFRRDTAAGEEVMKLLLGLQRSAPPECVVTDDMRARQQFRSGLAAMVVSGPGALRLEPAAATPSSPEQPIEVGVAPLPAREGRPALCDVEFRYVAVPAYVRGRRREAALEFVKFLASEPAQVVLANGVAGVAPFISIREDVLRAGLYEQDARFRAYADALQDAAPVLPSIIFEGKCAKDWIGSLHSLLIGDRRSVRSVVDVAYTRGNQALSCLYSDIGHPSMTMTLGMSLIAVLVFIAVAYAVSRH